MVKTKPTSWDDVPLVLNIQEVADLLGVHLNTIKKKVGDEIPARKVGRSWRVSKSDLQRYIELTSS